MKKIIKAIEEYLEREKKYLKRQIKEEVEYKNKIKEAEEREKYLVKQKRELFEKMLQYLKEFKNKKEFKEMFAHNETVKICIGKWGTELMPKGMPYWSMVLLDKDGFLYYKQGYKFMHGNLTKLTLDNYNMLTYEYLRNVYLCFKRRTRKNNR
ncbi:hypothetical protein D6777_02535 [Candidatus Woesearchaeota archaeon]|nr:MAG: hypothetical protein D6777_02535 [Candidatus Woesearchaeota archaeon]